MVAPMCPHGKAHWRHLQNTIELPICGPDAALCQITFTTITVIVVIFIIVLVVELLWTAPEILRSDELTTGLNKADVYAFSTSTDQ